METHGEPSSPARPSVERRITFVSYSAMRSSSTHITSTSSIRTAGPSSSSWVVLLPNQPHPQNTPKKKRWSRSKRFKTLDPALLEMSPWSPLLQGQALAPQAHPGLWALRCHPRNGRTKDRRRRPSSRIWRSQTFSAKDYPSTNYAAGKIHSKYTHYIPSTHTSARIYNSLCNLSYMLYLCADTLLRWFMWAHIWEAMRSQTFLLQFCPYVTCDPLDVPVYLGEHHKTSDENQRDEESDCGEQRLWYHAKPKRF